MCVCVCGRSSPLVFVPVVSHPTQSAHTSLGSLVLCTAKLLATPPPPPPLFFLELFLSLSYLHALPAPPMCASLSASHLPQHFLTLSVVSFSPSPLILLPASSLFLLLLLVRC